LVKIELIFGESYAKIEKVGNRHFIQVFYLAFGYKKGHISLDFTIFPPQRLQKIKLPFIFSLTFGRDLGAKKNKCSFCQRIRSVNGSFQVSDLILWLRKNEHLFLPHY